ncbi:hypothetical protein [Halobacillus sp. Marseille-P3879]|uniref:hypothetical protein n=1 Tax=Halobacillus sp. Marseille-P3879 TaxID=2045014 RepID=UPI000C79CDD3|nr:hypothetical protein [Halobacillus sp. Marseille-P3879]
MNLPLGKDEEVTSSEKFTTNLVLSWLKTDFSLKRLVGLQPNTLLGVFPFGKSKVSYPLKNVASVGVSTKLHLRRLGDSFLGGLILLAIGSLPLLNSYTSRMITPNNAGHPVRIEISILEKDKVQQFVNKVISDVA